MKKIKIFSIAIMAALLCLCTMQFAFADAVVTPGGYFEYNGMTYKLDTAKKEATTFIYGTYNEDTDEYVYTLTEATIVVPETIPVGGETYKVIKIGDYTFGAPKGDRSPTGATANSATSSITLPEGITEIGEYALSYFKNTALKIKIPSTVTTVGANAFSGSSTVTEIDFKDSRVTAIPNACFNNCYALQKLELPSTVETIHMNAFANARALTKVIINSESVTFTRANDDYGFPAAFGIRPSDIANGQSKKVPTVFYVKTNAIKEQIKELAANDVVANNKTYDLSGLRGDAPQIKLFFEPFDPTKKPIVEGEANTITYEPYYDPDVKDIIIGAIITGNDIAANSEAEIEIPATIDINNEIKGIPVKAVGPQAFCYFVDGTATDKGKTIKSIVLPETVTSIGKEAFYKLNTMETFVARGNIELTDADTGILQACSSLTEIDFANINMLTATMFDYCIRLKTIVIPSGESITINKTAFDRCTALENVYLNASEVTFTGKDNKGTMKNGTMNFHVPQSAKAALTEYGIPAANVIDGKKLYILDNLLGAYAVASEEMNEGKVIVATYNGGELDEVSSIRDVKFAVGYNKVADVLSKDGVERKVFVWKDLETIIPLGAMLK